MSPLHAQLLELYRRLNDRAPDEEVAEAIRQAQEDNGFAGEAPAWLVDALAAVLDGTEVGPVVFDKIGSDAGSMLAELADLIPGWEHDDQGESIAITFPALGLRLFLSNEALTPERTRASSYLVDRR